ncbi:hypothetical protein [Sphingobium yanoikuyae]|uniref:hypothetical protein n=1 Tax=Sphingobium yanoikuyae TaxID=13690 RepID=UPI00138E0038|nr:hypothetical protein [Sphingobium yanoikuyae]
MAKAVRDAGISLDQVVFFTDEEGVDNVDIYPGDEADEVYRERVEKLMSYAAQSGAAMGFHFKPRLDAFHQSGESIEQPSKSKWMALLFRKLFGAGR